MGISGCRMRSWGQTVTRELDPAKHTILMCHHGMRSQQAAEYLESLGFSQLSNVEGGIHAYSMSVDQCTSKHTVRLKQCSSMYNLLSQIVGR